MLQSMCAHRIRTSGSAYIVTTSVEQFSRGALTLPPITHWQHSDQAGPRVEMVVVVLGGGGEVARSTLMKLATARVMRRNMFELEELLTAAKGATIQRTFICLTAAFTWRLTS